jgi:hypothetical protein
MAWGYGVNSADTGSNGQRYGTFRFQTTREISSPAKRLLASRERQTAPWSLLFREYTTQLPHTEGCWFCCILPPHYNRQQVCSHAYTRWISVSQACAFPLGDSLSHTHPNEWPHSDKGKFCKWPKNFTEVTMTALKKPKVAKCNDHRTHIQQR